MFLCCPWETSTPVSHALKSWMILRPKRLECNSRSIKDTCWPADLNSYMSSDTTEISWCVLPVQINLLSNAVYQNPRTSKPQDMLRRAKTIQQGMAVFHALIWPFEATSGMDGNECNCNCHILPLYSDFMTLWHERGIKRYLQGFMYIDSLILSRRCNNIPKWWRTV